MMLTILFLILFLCVIFYLRVKLSSEIEFEEKKIEKFGRTYKEKD